MSNSIRSARSVRSNHSADSTPSCPSHIPLPGSPLILGLSSLTSDYVPRSQSQSSRRRLSTSSQHHHHHHPTARASSTSPSLHGISPRIPPRRGSIRSPPISPLISGTVVQQHGTPRMLGTPLMPVRETGTSGGSEEVQEQDISLGRPAIDDQEDKSSEDDLRNGLPQPSQRDEDQIRAEVKPESEQHNEAPDITSSPSHHRPGSIHELFSPHHVHFDIHPHSHPAASETSSTLHALEEVDLAGSWLMTDFGQGRKESDGSIAWSEGWGRVGYAALGAAFCVVVGAGVVCGVMDCLNGSIS